MIEDVVDLRKGDTDFYFTNLEINLKETNDVF